MEGEARFLAEVEEAARRFRDIPAHLPVKLVSHLDADGLSSCAILVRAMRRSGRLHAVRIVQTLDDQVLRELAREHYAAFLFSDIGSGQLDLVARHLHGRAVFVIDHHPPVAEANGVVLVNPHLFGIGGTCGAAVAFLFARALDPANEDMAHLAIVGLLGDQQQPDGGTLNRGILEVALRAGRIRVARGLRLFGMRSRPLHKALEYSTDPYIPGVSGSESGAIQFLREIGISPKDGAAWRKVVDLGEEEMRALATGIVLRRMDREIPEDILGDVYLIEGEAEDTPLRDAKEFATLLNACGRMDRSAAGIGACLGDGRLRSAALDTLVEYRRSIMSAMRWVERNPEAVRREKGYVLIDAGENIPHSIIGTVASMLSRNREFQPGTLILSMAAHDRHLKLSLRSCGKSPADLGRLMGEISSCIPGAIGGGHASAAGALVPTEQHDTLLHKAHEVLSRVAREERVA